jgi:cytochrome b561
MNRPYVRYTATAIGLHWLMAAMLVMLVCVGVYMHGLPLSPWKLRVFSWHKWAGVTAFLLVIVRLVWRSRHRPPELPAAMSPAARLIARAAHGAIYLLLFAIPLSGWLMSSAKGFPTVYLGVLPIPDLVAKNKELGEALLHVHQLLNVLLAGLVAGHSAAALKHHFIDRDDVFTRMLPRSGT